MGRWTICLLVSALLPFFAGCEATTPPPSAASQRGLSTIPWNRPAKWEGGGVLGSQMGAMRGY